MTDSFSGVAGRVAREEARLKRIFALVLELSLGASSQNVHKSWCRA